VKNTLTPFTFPTQSRKTWQILPFISHTNQHNITQHNTKNRGQKIREEKAEPDEEGEEREHSTEDE